MAYSIFFIEMQLLSEQFKMSDKKSANVKSMATFVALFHSKAFLQSRLSSISPSVDLKYFRHMQLYKKVNEKAAQVVISSIQKKIAVEIIYGISLKRLSFCLFSIKNNRQL
jgi:hypothetical protein